MALRIGFLIFPDFQILDLTGPLAAFQAADALGGGDCYSSIVMSRDGGLVSGSAALEVATVRASRQGFDTFIVPGGRGTRAISVAEAHAPLVRGFAARSRRTASVCTGAFLLAAAGLLDGKRATTHWRHATALQRRHPNVRVEGERIFIKDGPIWSSAGVTAGIDLALALIEEDFGRDLSRAVAQELVVYHRRPGSQSQFSAMLALEPESDRVRRALGFAREHLHENLPVERLAAAASLSPRQFGRAFRAETGETPAKAVERLRAEAARARIESGSEPVERVAEIVGFADPERMRRAFLRLFGQPPQALRRAARTLRVGAA
ncbi:MAG TPA: helix-turn-helix domain-containing protein [Stellaceae bacterium]|nr:helix-turn-helix domain-containing protein [Stellaceae bacterium]